MLLPNTQAYSQVLFFSKALKWAEVLLLGVFLVFVGWLFYTNLVCNSSFCAQVKPSPELFTKIIHIFLPVLAILNSLRIGFMFLLHDPDDDTEYLFYISLVGLCFSYIIFGLFYQEFLAISTKKQTDSLLFFAELLLIMITIVSLLKEKSTWDKSPSFVKIRITLSLMYLVVLVINPILGLLLGVILIPIMILLPEPKLPSNS